MKILHVTPTYLPAWRYGGPIRSVHGLCRALVKQGHEVHVYTSNVDGDKNLSVPVNVPALIDGVFVKYFEAQIRRLYWCARMEEELQKTARHFDVIHAHSVFLRPTWAAARIAEWNNVPFVVSPRGMLIKSLINRKRKALKNLWIRSIEKHTLEHASAVHATTTLEANEIAAFKFRIKRLSVIANGADESACSVDDVMRDTYINADSGKPYILFLGRINWKKGIDRLIEALPLIPNVDLVIAGNDEEGYRHKLDELALRKGVTNRIRYTGYVDGAAKSSLLKHACLFALPSHSENFGNVVLEAMSHGTPVVVTPEVGLAEFLRERNCGLVVDAAVDKMAAAIASLVQDKNERQRMGEAARKAVREFSWKSIAEEMTALYQVIQNEPRS